MRIGYKDAGVDFDVTDPQEIQTLTNTSAGFKNLLRALSIGGGADVTAPVINVNYPFLNSNADTITLPVGTYRYKYQFMVTLTGSTLSSALRVSVAGNGTVVGTEYKNTTGNAANGGNGVQYQSATPLGNMTIATSTSSLDGRVYSVQADGIIHVTTAGTLIPSFQSSVTHETGIATIGGSAYFFIEQLSDEVITATSDWS